jgi:hypothetical protein
MLETGKAMPEAKCSRRRVAIQTRFDEDTFAKGKVLAAIYDESFNATLVRALKNEIQRYEDRYGTLPRQIVPEESIYTLKPNNP